MVNDTLWATENKLITAVTVMDLSVAFDTVSHDFCSLYSEKDLEIKDVALNWYENYLKLRCFKVCINKIYSSQNNGFHTYSFVMHQHSMK